MGHWKTSNAPFIPVPRFEKEGFMKRFVAVLTVLFLFSGSAFAIGAGYGMRGMAMGGTGIAIANDVISAAYFNPAGLAYGPNFDAQFFAGGDQQLITAAQNKKFLSDNFDADMNLNGAKAMAGVGLSFKNVGVSVLADATGTLNHKGGDVWRGVANAQVVASTPITLATEFSKPGTTDSNEASIAVGLNLKPINLYGGGLDFTTPVFATQTQMTGSGFGFDLGMQTKISPKVSFGVVVRNIATSYTYTTKKQGGTIDGFGEFSPYPGSTFEVTSNGPDTLAPEVGVGFGFGNPETGTLVALDVENYSYADSGNKNQSLSATDIHLGVEQGLIFNGVVLRAGYFNYSPTNDIFYTYGVGVNAGPLNVGLAATNSQKDENASSSLIQVGITL